MPARKSTIPPKQLTISQLYPKYYKDVQNISEIDVYAVHALFNLNDPSGALQHASKKLLLAGQRTGEKTFAEDIKEARDTLSRYLIMLDQNILQTPDSKE